MSTEVLEASPESIKRSDMFLSKSADMLMKGSLQSSRIGIGGGTSCALSVVVESDHVGALSAETLPSPVVSGGGGAGVGAGRKRHHSHSTSKSAGQIKRRRKTYERKGQQPKFLLGGSITDPLNLNSLNDEEISKLANAVTPASSPLPHINKDPDPVIVPQDFKDPLKLNSVDDSEETNSSLTKTLVSRKSSGKKKKNNGERQDGKRDSLESSSSSNKNEESSCARPLWLELQNNSKTAAKLANKIVSPVLPDSRGRKRKASRSEPSSRLAKALLIDDLLPFPKDKTSDLHLELKKQRKSPEAAAKFRRQQSHEAKPTKHKPKFRDQDKRFQYGNYARYYGYRNPDSDDPRIDLFRREWFEGKKCMDIGCNSGHVTLAVAKRFQPAKMVGLDIDGHLIGVARKNVKHCLEDQYRERKGMGNVQFPVSMEKSYGPLAVPSTSSTASASTSSVRREKYGASAFPANVLFRCANFVLEKDSLLDTQKEEFDTILCLSITKWVHLNWGDAGLKRFFRRIFRALNPGGHLVLEPQAWPSYKKKRKITETTYKMYEQIRFKPHQFKEYLLSPEVGFASCEVIGTPLNKSKGFRRPILMFTKLDVSSHPVSRRPSPARALPITTSSTRPTAATNPTAATDVTPSTNAAKPGRPAGPHGLDAGKRKPDSPSKDVSSSVASSTTKEGTAKEGTVKEGATEEGTAKEGATNRKTEEEEKVNPGLQTETAPKRPRVDDTVAEAGLSSGKPQSASKRKAEDGVAHEGERAMKVLRKDAEKEPALANEKEELATKTAGENKGDVPDKGEDDSTNTANDLLASVPPKMEVKGDDKVEEAPKLLRKDAKTEPVPDAKKEELAMKTVGENKGDAQDKAEIDSTKIAIDFVASAATKKEVTETERVKEEESTVKSPS